MQRIRNLAITLASLTVVAAGMVVAAGTGAAAGDRQPQPLGAKTADRVATMVGEINAGNVKRSIGTLAGFGTRQPVLAVRSQPGHRRRS